MKGFRKAGFWGGLLVCFVLVFSLGVSQANACAIPCPDCIPEWWTTADARIDMPSWTLDMWDGGGGTADGTKGYDFSYSTFETPEGAFLAVNLENEENQNMEKKFFVGLHVSSSQSYLPFVKVTSYYADGSVVPLEYVASNEGLWFCLEETISPQPGFESFLIKLSNEDGAAVVDYVKLGTKCVPIPSTLLLLGGGLVGLVGIRKKLKSRG